MLLGRSSLLLGRQGRHWGKRSGSAGAALQWRSHKLQMPDKDTTSFSRNLAGRYYKATGRGLKTLLGLGAIAALGYAGSNANAVTAWKQMPQEEQRLGEKAQRLEKKLQRLQEEKQWQEEKAQWLEEIQRFLEEEIQGIKEESRRLEELIRLDEELNKLEETHTKLEEDQRPEETLQRVKEEIRRLEEIQRLEEDRKALRKRPEVPKRMRPGPDSWNRIPFFHRGQLS